MELEKDIYFNTDKLIENTKVKVSYTGKFYQGNNDKVFIHYGYGTNWNNLNELEMIKTDLGYQTELTLSGEDTLNFCFKNQNNEWDNNFGKNYVFDIEKNTSGIIEEVISATPNSVDTVINLDNTKIVDSVLANAQVNSITNSIKNGKHAENSIALAPTGFTFWTIRIKETVCKFFSYVPKLMSGNYKRDLSNNKNK